MHTKTIIIAGSGVAGLATAIRLSVQGHNVHVYEKNSYPGGKLSAFEIDGFKFDAGPSLFTCPENIEELFALTGEDMREYLNYKPVEIACRYFYPNGKKLNGYSDRAQFAEELFTHTGEPQENVIRYLTSSEKAYKNIATVFTGYSLHRKKTWLHKRTLKAVSSLKLPYLFSSLHRYNRRQFKSPETVQLFDRFATYNGSNPFKAPAMLSVIPHLEHNAGVFYPEGGMISITNALYKLAKKTGIGFHFNTAVDRIIYRENKITGVVAGGVNIHADAVVSNSDIYFTYKDLLSHQVKANKILKQDRSSSAFVFYWGMNKSFPDMQLHNIFFSGDYAAEFKSIFKTHTVHTDPTVYINVTSKMESGNAPEGHENWFVMINLSSGLNLPADELKATVKKYVVAKLNAALGEDIERYIIAEDILDPAGIEKKTGSFAGAIYGTGSNSATAAFKRHPNFTGYIRNMYFCGGSVHPGGGIPLCLQSAKIVSEIIAHDLKKNRH